MANTGRFCQFGQLGFLDDCLGIGIIIVLILKQLWLKTMRNINKIITFLIVVFFGYLVYLGAGFYKNYRLEKLVEGNPQSAEYLERLKNSEDKLKDKDKENDFEALFQIAFDREALGDHDGAIKYYKKALKISPNGALAKWNLANIYKELDQREEAEKLYKENIKQDPANSMYYQGLGELYRGWQGKELEEPALYLRGLEASKDNLAIIGYLAGYFRHINDEDNAKYWENKILEIRGEKK